MESLGGPSEEEQRLLEELEVSLAGADAPGHEQPTNNEVLHTSTDYTAVIRVIARAAQKDYKNQ